MSINELLEDLRRTRPYLRRAEWFNEGKKTQRSLSILLPPELRYLSETIGITELVNEILEERQEIRDVEAPGFPELTQQMRDWREDQDLPEIESQTTMEKIALGRGYVAVSARSARDNTPVFTVESPHNMIHRSDPRTLETLEVVREYGDPTDPAIAYYNTETVNYLRRTPLTNRWVADPDVAQPQIAHGLGECPVVPFVHRQRVLDRYGKPAAKRIWSLQEDMSRCLTDLAAACALLAIPQRAVFGIDKAELKDASGNDVPAAQLWMARLLTLSDSNAKIAEFAAAQLNQFTSTYVAYARMASSLVGVPIVFFGVASEANPASGDAQRADMDRLNKKSERMCRADKRPWKSVYRLGAKVAGVTDPDALRAIKVNFENPATNTLSQQAAAVAALANIRRLPDALFTPQYLMDIMHVSPEKQEEMDATQTVNALDALIGQLPPAPPEEPVGAVGGS